MRTRLPIALVFAACVTVVGCSRPPLLVQGPLRLDRQPASARLESPVTWQGQDWELCFEFERPGDSHGAGTVATALVVTTGAPVPMRVVEVDRRGEATVCHVVRVATPSKGPPTEVRGLELRAGRPLDVRAIHGGRL